MRKTKTAVLPGIDFMEPRLLLSSAAPLLSEHALSGVVREVRAIVTTLARTEDTLQASAQLSGLSSRLPYGSEGLAPSWQSDLGLYRAQSVRSIVSMEKRLVGDLHRYVRAGVDTGNQPVSGSGSTSSSNPMPGEGGTAAPSPAPTPTQTPSQGTAGSPAPLPMSALDSVRIQNTTGLALLVTVHLKVSQIQQPYLTETISAQANSIVSFDFGTATDAFMTMDVRRADGLQSPAPFNNINLSQPINGYNGALFTISLFGPYFNVTEY